MSNYKKCKKAGAILIDKNIKKCLLVYQKKSRMWGIPKGSIEQKESEKDGMFREVKEEAGIDMKNIPYTLVNAFRVRNMQVYVMRLATPHLPLLSPPLEKGYDNHEIGLVKWFSIEKLLRNYIRLNSLTKSTLPLLKKIYEESIVKAEEREDMPYGHIFHDHLI